MCILLREHPVGDTDKDMINLRHISKTLAKDWGFCYTVTTNLKKLQKYVEESPVLSSDDKSTIENRSEAIATAIEKEPKTLKWKMREKIGTSRKWYNVVEEVQRDDLSG
jgi:hypothetical protein